MKSRNPITWWMKWQNPEWAPRRSMFFRQVSHALELFCILMRSSKNTKNPFFKGVSLSNLCSDVNEHCLNLEVALNRPILLKFCDFSAWISSCGTTSHAEVVRLVPYISLVLCVGDTHCGNCSNDVKPGNLL